MENFTLSGAKGLFLTVVTYNMLLILSPKVLMSLRRRALIFITICESEKEDKYEDKNKA
jgi:hypothetical protein